MQESIDAKIKKLIEAGASDEEIIAMLKPAQEKISAPYPLPDTRPPLPEMELQNALSQGTTSSKPIPEVLQNLRLPLSLLGGLGGGLVAGPVGAAAGSGITDTLINKFSGAPDNFPISEFMGITSEGKPPTGNSVIDTLLSAGENTLLGEGIGRGIGVGFKVGRNIVKEADAGAKWIPRKGFLPEITGNTAILGQKTLATIRDKALGKFSGGKGTITGDISSLDPTFNQMQVARGKVGTISGLSENMFNRSGKADALVNSAKKTVEEAEVLASKVAGKKISVNDADKLATSLQIQAQVNFENLQDEIKILRGVPEYGLPDGTIIPRVPGEIELAERALMANPKDKALQKAVTNLNIKQAELLVAKQSYFPGYERGVAVKDLLEETPASVRLNKPNPVIDAVLYDEVKMQRMFETGQIKAGGKQITFANPKKNLGAYGFVKFIDDATDHSTATINSETLLHKWNAFKVTDAGKKLYNNNQIADISQFFEKLSHVSQQIGDRGASKYLTLRLGTATAALGGGLISGIVSGQVRGVQTAGAIIGGAIGMHQLGKLMTNPDTARLMIAAVSGGPLGMAPAVASRLIGRALRGQEISVETKDPNGNVINLNGKVDSMGKFQIAGDPGIKAKY